MNQQEALQAARQQFGDAQVSVIPGGIFVIAIREEQHYIPLGYGGTWEEALIDARAQKSMECVYA
jgi:hypothetical protein